MKTKVINLIAAPGAGKSTSASGIFYALKQKNVTCELINECAKELVYENSINLLKNQIHVFSEQFRRQWRLLGKVEYIITDSPLILSSIYHQYHANKYDYPFSESHLVETAKYFDHTFLEFDNINFYIKRTETYDKDGRLQTEDETSYIDMMILDKLIYYKIPYISTTTTTAVSDVLRHLGAS